MTFSYCQQLAVVDPAAKPCRHWYLCLCRSRRFIVPPFL